jgi:hypothetical protein
MDRVELLYAPDESVALGGEIETETGGGNCHRLELQE